MKVVYITAHAPFGTDESFVLDEMLAVTGLGIDLIIVPRDPPRQVFHEEAQGLLTRSVTLPILNWRMILQFIWALLSRPRLWSILWTVARHSRSQKILIKNLAVLPKAVFVAALLNEKEIDHIHAHWGSTTSSMAWTISGLMGIPWSFTLHRWDIAENNLLEIKVEHACFARCIGEAGRREVLSIVGDLYQDKVRVLHLGARMPVALPVCKSGSHSDFVVACPANFFPVKGHRFLVKAFALLRARGYKNCRCLLIGDGPLQVQIRAYVTELGLKDVVTFTGRLPHGRLMQLYESGEVHAVVLPSIMTADGQKEGIPVALMEAMSHGIPVVSTDTGSIPELVCDGAGLLVKQQNPDQLADALQTLIEDRELSGEIGRKGNERVKSHFNLVKNVTQLLELMKQHKKTLA